jgi:hypothetical protein
MTTVFPQAWERTLLPLAYEAEHQVVAPTSMPASDPALLDRLSTPGRTNWPQHSNVLCRRSARKHRLNNDSWLKWSVTLGTKQAMLEALLRAFQHGSMLLFAAVVTYQVPMTVSILLHTPRSRYLPSFVSLCTR